MSEGTYPREARYIRYDEQDAYRAAGWTIRPFTHHPMAREYSLIASRAIVEGNR